MEGLCCRVEPSKIHKHAMNSGARGLRRHKDSPRTLDPERRLLVLAFFKKPFKVFLDAPAGSVLGGQRVRLREVLGRH